MQVSVRQPSHRLATACPDYESLVPDQKSITISNDSEFPVISSSYFRDLETRPRTMGSLVDSKAPAASVSGQPVRSSTHESLINLSNHSRRRLPRRGVTQIEERASLKELAAFLRTRDPPPSNYMSHPDCYDISSTNKSPFKIFRRPFDKKTVSAQARHLQLPDSAVAAKTSQGHWHIAISIPLSAIGDHFPTAPSWDASAAAAKQSGLKLDTSASTLCLESVGSKTQCPTPKDAAASNTVLGTDAVTTLKNYYRSERLLEGRYATEPSRNAPPKGPLKDRPFVPVTALDLNRRNSGRTDHRHSGGTVYSERTLESFTGHSRGTSSVSTAPSTGPLVPLPLRNVELPIRRSSRQQTGGKAIIDPPSPGSKSTVSREKIDEEVPIKSVTSTSCYSNSSSTNAKLTEALHSFNASDAISSIRNAPRTPAPTRALPDLPECSDDGRSQRSRSSLIISTEVLLPHGHPLKDLRESPKRNACPARQEKVKALRARDMAALKEAKSRSEAMAVIMKSPTRPAPIVIKATTTTPFFQIPAKNPSRQLKRRSYSGSPVSLTAIKEGGPNRLSPIMTVASTHPNLALLPPSSSSSADCLLSTRRYGHGYGHRKTRSAAEATTSSRSPLRALTLPRSLTPSLASNGEETVHLPNHSRKSSACTSPSATSSPMSTRSRRREIGVGRDVERGRQAQNEARDLEIRLQKLENSNEFILQTLGAVVQMGADIKELNQLLKAQPRVGGNGGGLPRIAGPEPADAGRRGGDRMEKMSGLGDDGRGREMQMQQREIIKMKSDEELECMEPLMEELKKWSRVSQEIPVEEADEEEEEGYDLLF